MTSVDLMGRTSRTGEARGGRGEEKKIGKRVGRADAIDTPLHFLDSSVRRLAWRGTPLVHFGIANHSNLS